MKQLPSGGSQQSVPPEYKAEPCVLEVKQNLTGQQAEAGQCSKRLPDLASCAGLPSGALVASAA